MSLNTFPQAKKKAQAAAKKGVAPADAPTMPVDETVTSTPAPQNEKEEPEEEGEEQAAGSVSKDKKKKKKKAKKDDESAPAPAPAAGKKKTGGISALRAMMEEKRRLEEEARRREEEERKRVEEEERKAEEEARRKEEEKQRRKEKEKERIHLVVSGRHSHCIFRPNASSRRKKVVFLQRNRKRNDRWRSSENKLFWLPGFKLKVCNSLLVAVCLRKWSTEIGRRNLLDKRTCPRHRNRDQKHQILHLSPPLKTHRLRVKKMPNPTGRPAPTTRVKPSKFRLTSKIPGMLQAMKKKRPVIPESKTLGMPPAMGKSQPQQLLLKKV
jgi:hypothetical protein